MCWAKVKAILLAAAMRTIDSLAMAAHYGAEQVSLSDVAGWFRHCGHGPAHAE